MAYKGGFLLKPVKVDYGSVGKMYMQGINAVAQIREGVLKERAEQRKQLAEAVDFQATGIHDIDRMALDHGQSVSSELSIAQQKVDAGLMTRTQQAAIHQRAIAESQSLGSLVDVMSKNIEAIDKDDSLSDLTKDQLTNLYFKDINYRGFYRDPNTGEVRDLKQGFQIKRANGQSNVFGTYEYINPNNNQIESVTINKPLVKMIDPSYHKWQKADTDAIDKKIKGLISRMGERDFVIMGPDGIPVNIPYEKTQEFANGDVQVYNRIADVSQFMPALESHIDSQDRKFYEAYAYEQLGARAPWHSGYSGPLSDEQVNQRFNKRYIDKNGELIEVKNDPTQFRFNEEGDIFLDEDALNVVKGHYRQQILASLNIKSEDYKLKSDDQKKQEEVLRNLAGAKYNRLEGGKVIAKNYDSDYIKSNILLEIAIVNKDMYENINLGDAMSDYNSNGYTDELDNLYETETGPVSPIMKRIISKGTEYKGVSLDPMKKTLTNALGNVLSHTGQKFDAINAFTVVEISGSKPLVLLNGTATAGKRKRDIGDDKVEIEREITEAIPSATSEPLTDDQSRLLYKQLWKIPNAAKYFKEEGYSINAPDYLTALADFAGFMNK